MLGVTVTRTRMMLAAQLAKEPVLGDIVQPVALLRILDQIHQLLVLVLASRIRPKKENLNSSSLILLSRRYCSASDCIAVMVPRCSRRIWSSRRATPLSAVLRRSVPNSEDIACN